MPSRRAAFAVALPLLLSWPALAIAEPTGACHCYRDRSFDPERPAAADPYILATTRSSLLSAVFGVEKRSLVSAVMTGTDPDDLWIAHWAGARLDRPAAILLGEREARGSWPAALASSPGLPPSFAALLRAGAPSQALASLAVDDTLRRSLRVTSASLDSLRLAGATTPELILATVLSARLEAPTAPLVAQVHAGRATWGEVLRDAGLSPRQLDALVRSLVAAAQPAR